MKQQCLSTNDRAHLERNIKLLLQPMFHFRLYVVFSLHDGRPGPKRHFYGNEHQCTYQQLLSQKLPYIEMNKNKGYKDLVHLVEGAYYGRYISAKIYGREPGQINFDSLHRDYFRGKLLSQSDPEIPVDEQCYKLTYRIESGRVIINDREIK
jgi:hypothetical protein